jgi:nucleosome-remodeling factor subunit BPTF
VLPVCFSGKLLNSILTSKSKTSSEVATTVVDTENDRSVKMVTNQNSSTEIGQMTENRRVYSAASTKGCVYLKKVSVSVADRRKKRTPVKYPLCSTFQTRSKRRNMLILPQHELRRLSRLGGRMAVNGYHHLAKVYCSLMYRVIYKFLCVEELDMLGPGVDTG